MKKLCIECGKEFNIVPAIFNKRFHCSTKCKNKDFKKKGLNNGREALIKYNKSKGFKSWTDEEMSYLKNNYRIKTNIEMGKELKRTSSAICTKLQKLNLYRGKELSNNLRGKQMSGKNHPMFGKKLSKEHIKKLSIAKKGKSWEELYGVETARKMRVLAKKRVPLTKRIDLRNNPKEIIKLYNKGVSSTKIGKKFNCSHGLIISILKENNIPIDWTRSMGNSSKKEEFRTSKMINKIKSLIKDGRACREIGRTIGCSRKTVKNILLENNLPIPKYIRSEKTRKIISENTKRYMGNPKNKEIRKENRRKKGFHIWTKAEDDYLRNNLNSKSNKELSSYFNVTIPYLKYRLEVLNLRRNHFWTKEKDDYLKNNYNLKWNEELEEYLEIPISKVRTRLSFLNLKRPAHLRRPSIWDKEKDNYLKNNLNSKSNKELSNSLGIKIGKVKSRLITLNLKRNPIWTKEENDYLKNNYNIKGNRELGRYLNVPSRVINVRLKTLGLKRDNLSKFRSAAAQGIDLKDWKGPIAFEPYDIKFNKNFKRKIRERDNQICMLCNIHREKLTKALFIHHIDYDKKNTTKENCISLCISCHPKTNGNRKQWTQFFQSLLSEKYGYEYNIINNEKGGIIKW